MFLPKNLRINTTPFMAQDLNKHAPLIASVTARSKQMKSCEVSSSESLDEGTGFNGEEHGSFLYISTKAVLDRPITTAGHYAHGVESKTSTTRGNEDDFKIDDGDRY